MPQPKQPPVSKGSAAKKPFRARPAAEPVPAPEPTSAAARDEALRANLASLRDLLAGGVVLTAQRLQDSVDDAVARGRMTRRDAEELASALVAAGRQQTSDLVADVETLLGRGRSDLGRARRATRLGGGLPIEGYDELTARQVRARLEGLSAAELRRVRTHETRHAKRKTVLAAITAALG